MFYVFRKLCSVKSILEILFRNPILKIMSESLFQHILRTTNPKPKIMLKLKRVQLEIMWCKKQKVLFS